MGVCLVTGGYCHYSGTCGFSAVNEFTTIVAYAGLLKDLLKLRHAYVLCSYKMQLSIVLLPDRFCSMVPKLMVYPLFS